LTSIFRRAAPLSETKALKKQSVLAGIGFFPYTGGQRLFCRFLYFFNALQPSGLSR